MMRLPPPSVFLPIERCLRRIAALCGSLSLALPQLPAAPEPASTEPQVLRLALSANVFRNTNVNDATAAYRVFLERLARRKGYQIRVETEIYDDDRSYQQALNRDDRPLHLSVLIAWHYLQMDLPPSIHPRWMVTENEQPGRAYLVLARRDRNWQSLADLRGRSITWLEFAHSSVTTDWMATLLHEQQLPEAGQFFGEIVPSPKASAVVLPVFFGTKDACLVDEYSFQLMGELNPQVSRSLVPLARSDRLADVLICLNESPWATEAFKQDIAAAITELHLNTDGRQILTLFGIRRIVPFDPAHLESARALLDRHRRRLSTLPP